MPALLNPSRFAVVGGAGGAALVTAVGTPLASTANVTSYATVAFTPTAGRLLVVTVSSSATADATATMTASANGLTFTRVQQAVWNGSFSSAYIFVADQMTPGSPAAMTLTFTCAADAATGALVAALEVAGMTKVGTAAILQSAKADNGTGTPAVTLPGSVQSNNPVIGVISSSALVTVPSGFTSRYGTNYSTPTTTIQVDSINTGHSGSSVTWGSTVGAWGAVAVELDST